ncbi:helix-turn-helix transcriptional regulator [Nitratireductor sp. GISD-1A_MAKvit]|uniref:helix-turn-helix transcriptional regulator n=1 Tax=Nitratireductor sp. GISD-1A_MAKvit TaxID=3234198 RepID=UPI003466922B
MTLSGISQQFQHLTEGIGAESFQLHSISSRNRPKLGFCLGHRSRRGRSIDEDEVDRLPRRFAEKLSDTFHPLVWGIELKDKELDTHWEMISAPVDENGLALPLSTEQRHQGVIIFLGSDIHLERNTLLDLHGQCHALFAQMMECQPFPITCNGPTISNRELQCLKLTANGLTSEEIAKRLGLSVHTANQYLANTTQKLDAVNRVHAVAKALRTGLID